MAISKCGSERLEAGDVPRELEDPEDPENPEDLRSLGNVLWEKRGDSWYTAIYCRRRIFTEVKANVVAAALGTELLQFLAALLFCTWTIGRIGGFAPGRFEE